MNFFKTTFLPLVIITLFSSSPLTARHGKKTLKKLGAHLYLGYPHKALAVVNDDLFKIDANLNNPYEDVLNTKNKISSVTPLTLAIWYDSLPVAQALLSKQINTSANIYLHNLPIAANVASCNYVHYAAKYGSSSMMKLLLKAGLGVSSVGSDGLTPLHYAAKKSTEAFQEKYNQPEMSFVNYVFNYISTLDILLRKGASLHQKDELGNTPTHYILAHLVSLDDQFQDLLFISDVLRLCTAYKADFVYEKNNTGETALEFARNHVRGDITDMNNVPARTFHLIKKTVKKPTMGGKSDY